MGRACEMCQRPLEPAGRGRPPRYCSRACRARAHRTRVAARSGAGRTAAADVDRSDGVPADPGLGLGRIVRAAVAVADREGVEGLSMRRTAAELSCGVMSLYRYVPGKDELIDLMVDAVFREHPLPEPGPPGWRAKLELSARREWAIYHDRPWLSPLVAATTRPPVALHMMAYTDWRMRAVDGLGLDFPTMLQVAIAISTHVQGSALALAQEQRISRQSRGASWQDWLEPRQWALQAAFTSGRLPMVSRFGPDAYRMSQPAAVFAFGLDRVLDGVAALLDAVGPGPARIRGE